MFLESNCDECDEIRNHGKIIDHKNNTDAGKKFLWCVYGF